MALDNAQFISQLSITDPPGTDAVAEGDDHIRTTKRAVQQSFPNVDAAVPQTAAQMGQMAIKNEVNAFTQANTFAPSQQFDHPIFLDAVNDTTDNVLFLRDSVPSGRWDIAFEAIATSGDFYIRRRNAAGASLDKPIIIAAATGRVTFAQICFFSAITRFADGNAVSPSLSFTTDADLGIYREQEDVIAFAAGAAHTLRIAPANIRFRDQLRADADGTPARPSYSFNNNTEMGIYRRGLHELGFSTQGVERMFLGSTGRLTLASNFTLDAAVTQAIVYRQGGLRNWELTKNSGTLSLAFHRYVADVFQEVTFSMNNATGNISMPSLPTVNPGGSGILWKSSGFVAIT